MTQDSKSPEQVAHEAASVVPTPRQIAWQEMEFTAFMHFTVNTFIDLEWGRGTEREGLFNPTALDARQWAQVCKDAGMKMLILTAKHHDGFCLWPSRHTEHSVKNSPWKNGKGDVVRETADACREAGIKFGVYCSPWDRNARTYGTPAYNDYFKNQLRELLTGYGEIGQVWFDGACGEGPNGKKQVYDWEDFFKLIRELQPDAVIGPCGPDVRWVGNESGYARESEWSVVGVDFDLAKPPSSGFTDCYRVTRYIEGKSVARASEPGSIERLTQSKHKVWWPAETDVSIRPGWFYHASQDLRVHSLERLLDMYYKSIGRNSVLLLNLPPDRRGLIHEHDVARLQAFRRALDKTFKHNLAEGRNATDTGVSTPTCEHSADKAVDGNPSTYWMAEDGTKTAAIEVDLGEPAVFNRAMLQEMISLGQRVEEYVIQAWHQGAWKEFVRGTTIGYKKLDRFSEISASRVRLTIIRARACPTIRSFGLYKAETCE